MRQSSHAPSASNVVEYLRTREDNNLVEFVFRCFLALSERDDALAYFGKNYIEDDPEVKLYVLVRLLFEYREKEHIDRVISDAEKKGVNPRAELRRLRNFIRQNEALPEFIGSLR
jgi:hypothetical protein